MLFFLLFIISRQKPTITPTENSKKTLNSCIIQTNTSRKYITHNEHFSGDWEYGGNASLIEIDKSMILASESKNSSGYAWLMHRLPSEQWIADISLSFEKGLHSSTIGIWMTKDFGISGEVFGGPSQFHGVCILTRYNGTSIFIEIRENDGHENFDKLFFYPTFIESLISPKLFFAINYTSPFLSVNVKIDGKIINIFNEKPRVKVRRHWFSITGKNYNEKLFSGNPIKINSVFFRGKKAPQIQKQIEFRKNGTVMSMLSALSNNLNNKNKFNKNEKNTNLPSEYSIDTIEIIKCFDELIDFSSSLSTTEEVLSVVNDQVTSFSDKWQRRAIGITKQTEEIREEIAKQLNNTEIALQQFNNDLQSELEDFKDDIHKIESDLYFKVLEGYKLSKQLKEEKKLVKKGGIPKKLMYVSIMEIAALALFFTLQSMNGHSHNF